MEGGKFKRGVLDSGNRPGTLQDRTAGKLYDGFFSLPRIPLLHTHARAQIVTEHARGNLFLARRENFVAFIK